MSDLEKLYRTIDALPPDQLAQTLAYVQQRYERLQQERQPTDREMQARIATLDRAFARLREGFSKEDLEELVWAMNVEHIDPDELEDFAWIDELPESER